MSKYGIGNSGYSGAPREFYNAQTGTYEGHIYKIVPEVVQKLDMQKDAAGKKIFVPTGQTRNVLTVRVKYIAPVVEHSDLAECFGKIRLSTQVAFTKKDGTETITTLGKFLMAFLRKTKEELLVMEKTPALATDPEGETLLDRAIDSLIDRRVIISVATAPSKSNPNKQYTNVLSVTPGITTQASVQPSSVSGLAASKGMGSTNPISQKQPLQTGFEGMPDAVGVPVKKPTKTLAEIKTPESEDDLPW